MPAASSVEVNHGSSSRARPRRAAPAPPPPRRPAHLLPNSCTEAGSHGRLRKQPRRGKHPNHIRARTINTAPVSAFNAPVLFQTLPLFTYGKGKKKTSSKNSPSGKRSPRRTAFFTLTFDLRPGAVLATGSVCWLGAAGWRLMVKPRPTDPPDRTLTVLEPSAGGEISRSSRSPTIRSAGCCSCPSPGG